MKKNPLAEITVVARGPLVLLLLYLAFNILALLLPYEKGPISFFGWCMVFPMCMIALLWRWLTRIRKHYRLWLRDALMYSLVLMVSAIATLLMMMVA
ncbi:hypothetical protein NT6N_24770 [Oceaniferula spumae]|uniref:Uncharacterized protein n=1 Tax=Oceaniferula spumae TaxID=2979115 RepID=A0AAT9FN95_9BACT